MARQENRKRVLTNPSLEAAIFSHLLRGRYASDLLPLVGADPEVFAFEPFCVGFERLQHLLAREGQLPTWNALIDDPALDTFRDSIVSACSRERIESRNMTTLREVTDSAAKLQELFYLRKMQAAAARLSELVYDGGVEVGDITGHYMQLNDLVCSGTVDDVPIIHLGENDDELFDNLTNPQRLPTFYPIGMPTYDQAVGGLPKSGLVLVGATTSGGKSAFANALAMNFSTKLCLDVCKVSLEMPRDQEYMRFMANRGQASMRNMRAGADITAAENARLRKAHDEFKRNRAAGTYGRLSFWCPGNTDVSRMLLKLQPYNYHVIIVDYIGLLEGADADNQALELSRIARTLKVHTQKTGQLVVALVQLDEDSKKVRYARAMKEHCDNLIIWYPTDDEKKAGEWMMHQVKGRDSGLLSWGVKFNGDTMTFTDAGVVMDTMTKGDSRADVARRIAMDDDEYENEFGAAAADKGPYVDPSDRLDDGLDTGQAEAPVRRRRVHPQPANQAKPARPSRPSLLADEYVTEAPAQPATRRVPRQQPAAEQPARQPATTRPRRQRIAA